MEASLLRNHLEKGIFSYTYLMIQAGVDFQFFTFAVPIKRSVYPATRFPPLKTVLCFDRALAVVLMM
jgi:hypothetical protein